MIRRTCRPSAPSPFEADAIQRRVPNLAATRLSTPIFPNLASPNAAASQAANTASSQTEQTTAQAADGDYVDQSKIVTAEEGAFTVLSPDSDLAEVRYESSSGNNKINNRHYL